MGKIISPFYGMPSTEEVLHHDGTMSFIIEPRALTPERAQLADIISGFCVVCLGIAGIATGLDMNYRPELVFPVMMGAIYAMSGPMDLLFRQLLKKKTRIYMTIGHFSVKGLLGYKHFDRTLPHKFSVIPHDKTREEQDKHALQERKDQAAGRITKRTRYYGESAHVVFEYVGQRFDVMTVFGQKDALAIAARLKACDGRLDAMAGMGEGIAFNPSDQWGDDDEDIE